jgi:hypothetical protein
MKNTKRMNELKAALIKCEVEVGVATTPIMDRARVLKAELKAEYAKAFKRNATLKTALSALECSTQLTSVPHDEYYHRFVRVDLSKVVDLQDADAKNALEEYLEDHSTCVDFEHSALTTCEGPSLIIDDEGDVYDQDSSKIAVKNTEYENTTERNALIEAWMERTGYYPSVIKVDRYGEPIGYVNTASKSKVG